MAHRHVELDPESTDQAFFLLTLCPDGWAVVKRAFEEGSVRDVELTLREEWFGYYPLDVLPPRDQRETTWTGFLSRDPYGVVCYEVAEEAEEETYTVGLHFRLTFLYDGETLRVRELSLRYEETSCPEDQAVRQEPPVTLKLAPPSPAQDFRDQLLRHEIGEAETLVDAVDPKAPVNGCLEVRVPLLADLARFLNLVPECPPETLDVMARVFARATEDDLIATFTRADEVLLVVDACPRPLTVRAFVTGRCPEAWAELRRRWPRLAYLILRTNPYRSLYRRLTLEGVSANQVEELRRLFRHHGVPADVEWVAWRRRAVLLVPPWPDAWRQALSVLASRSPHVAARSLADADPLVSRTFYV